VTERAHATIAEEPGILTVTFDRQEKLNAISPAMTAVLWEAVDRMAHRDDLRCMVITARGAYFTAGIDLKAGAGRDAGDPDTKHLHAGWNFRRNYRTHHLLYDEIENLEKPVIMAVQGTCLGAGVEMAASCDFRFASTAASFGVPEVRLGVIAGSGGTTRLTRLIGPHWGKWMAMADQRVDAHKAEMIGFVHEVCEPDALLPRVHEFCLDLMTIPAEVVGLAKVVVDIAADVHDRTVQRHVDRIANTNLTSSEEYRQRTARFVE
jgi:enoyl-CoA hydratase/carnithine racemase